tara:strand:+ start:2572 stop:3051 length:480 start_codon:yes stop_codon:yes gene_type:complete
MKFHHFCVFTASFYALSCVAAPPSELAKNLVDTARKNCEALDAGLFEVDPAYIVTLDLDGDGQPDELVDESHFSCSSSASLFTPNGGSMLHAIVNSAIFSWPVNAWRIVDWGRDKVLLLAEHGTECSGYGYQPCYEAVVFSEHRPMSVRPGESESSSSP